MKADTFAKLVVLEALLEAEIGYFLEHEVSSLELFREGMVSRISDLIDQIDVLDSVAAGRVYDAIVDFLAELPEDEEGIVEAGVRFRRAVDRIVARGMDRRDLAAASTWAVVLEELLAELAGEYRLALLSDDENRPREFGRAESLLTRARQAADRMLWTAEVARAEISDDMDRLTYAIRHRRLRPTAVEFLIRALQRRAAKYRPSTLTRIGVFVLRQVLRREPRRRGVEAGRSGREARSDLATGRRHRR
jgi:hypothetical protein